MTDRRRDIVQALADLLPEKGYAGATTARIASRAGMRQGLVHYYFPSKAAILDALVADLTERIEARLGAWQSADDLVHAALALGEGEDAGAVRTFVAVLGESGHAEVSAALSEHLQAWRGRIARSLGGDEEGAAGLLATILGYWLVGARFPAVVPTGSAAATAARMLSGLGERRPRPAGENA